VTTAAAGATPAGSRNLEALAPPAAGNVVPFGAMGRLRPLLGMRWWLGLAFVAVAGLTALAIVTASDERAGSAARRYAQELAVGGTVAASHDAKRAPTLGSLRTELALTAGRRRLALFAFDGAGRLLTPAVSENVRWPRVPGGRQAVAAALGGDSYIENPDGKGTRFVVGVRTHGGPAAAVVGYSAGRPELQGELGLVQREFLQSGLVAFAIAAILGLTIATLIARRLQRIAGAAQAIGAGDFDAEVSDTFPDEVGTLAASIEQMRGRLRELFARLEGDRDRLESLLERLNDGVLLVDRGLGVEYANRHARELLALEDGRLDESSAPRVAAFARDLFSNPLPGRVQLDEGGRTLALAGIPPLEDGDTAILVVVDETARERNERIQREFATNAAHELRTPIASIVTAVEMLRTGAKDDPEARDEFLDLIARESDRLTRLTRALLVLARADAGESSRLAQRVSVAPLLERVAETLPPRDDVAVRVDCPGGIAIRGDADLLEQAVASLATNAARQTATGSIWLRGRRENGSVVIEVADTGPGIHGPDRTRVFDRFYRGAAPDDRSGFGLGLSIARESVHALGGEIELGPEQVVGTTVRLRLVAAGAEERA
jgi:signal transduction histidine kinase